jgi:uncharacterized membrane protein YfcA
MERTSAPALNGFAALGWRTSALALGAALVIGGVGGLIGLGGGEFRLPILVGLIGFTARAAVPMNQLLSLITLVTALLVRWQTGSLVGVGVLAPAIVALGVGGMTAAWYGVRLLANRAGRSSPASSLGRASGRRARSSGSPVANS